MPTVTLRLAAPSDGEAIARIYRPAVVERATSFELVAPDGSEMARRIADLLPHFPWIVAEREGSVIGYAYAGRHRDRAAYQWSCDVSAYVGESVQRRGIGRTLYEVLFAHLVLQGYRNAYAGITLPNEASVGLHERVGFTLVGVYRKVGYKFGRWHDVAWYERQLAPRITEPPPPRPLSEILSEPAFAEIFEVRPP